MLKVEDLNVVYDKHIHAIRDASFELETGNIYGIIGSNGAGKSSLIKGMLNLVPSSGQVTFNGERLKKHAKRTSYVPQRADIDMTFPMTVFDCVLMGTYPNLWLIKRPGKKEKERTLESLKKVGMEDFKNRQIGELSGGQFQRILMARTLAQHSDIVFLDEPFVGIDVKSEKVIVNVLKEMARDGITILIVHHDLSKVHDYFDGLILVDHGVLDYGSVDKVFTEKNLKEAYGDNIIVKAGEA